MPDLMLSSPTPANIQKAKAALCPMTDAQKRDLYLALQAHPEYTLSGDGFSGVSAMDAEEIFAYFKGTRNEKPDCLRNSVDATMERVYQKRNTYLKQTFDKPIQKCQLEEISALLSSHGKSADMSALTQFDAINIRNCYEQQPFSEQPIGADAQQYLSRRLSERGLSLNREIQFVLPSEYDRVLDYLVGFTRTVPGLLKDSPRIDPMNADKLQSFMDAKGITSTIPVSAMSKADYDKMYGYIISQGQTPECVQPKTVDHTEDFVKSIQVDGITEKKQLLLLQLRNQMNEFLSLGIDPLHPEAFSSAISEFNQAYDALELERSKLAAEYKSLLQLSQQLTYAESPSFIFGSLFDEKVHESPEVVVKRERDQKEPDAEKMPDENGKKSVMDVDMDL